MNKYCKDKALIKHLIFNYRIIANMKFLLKSEKKLCLSKNSLSKCMYHKVNKQNNI